MPSISNLYEQRIEFAISAGKMPGVKVFRQFGRNAAVGSSFETVWPESTLHLWMVAAAVQKISSSSTADTITGPGTGAHTVLVEGLDANYVEIFETVILNGQTAVNTVGSYLRVYRLTVITAGTGFANAGIVYAGTGSLTAGKPAVVNNLIPVAVNHSLSAFYTIPARMKGYITHHEQSSSISKAIESHLYVRPFGEVFQVKDSIDYTVGEMVYDPQFPVEILEKSDIELRALAGGGGGAISAGFGLLLVQY